MLKLLITSCYLLGTPAPVSHKYVPPRLPLAVSAQDWRPLSDWTNLELQRRLVARLARNRLWASLIRKQKMAVGVVDLSRPDSVRFASVNGETMMYAASLPKIAILLGACQAFEDHTLKETPGIVHDVEGMIRNSDNQAATRMIDRLGFAKIATVLQDSTYKLFDPAEGGGLWVGKRYARSGPRHPDPLKGLVHAANVLQVCRFYYLLATGRLINQMRCRQMLNILSNTHLHHKFVHTLDVIEPFARVFRKSGTWRIWHADSVLVWGYDRRYILVGLVEDRRGERILRDLVSVVEEVLYR